MTHARGGCVRVPVRVYVWRGVADTACWGRMREGEAETRSAGGEMQTRSRGGGQAIRASRAGASASSAAAAVAGACGGRTRRRRYVTSMCRGGARCDLQDGEHTTGERQRGPQGSRGKDSTHTHTYTCISCHAPLTRAPMQGRRERQRLLSFPRSLRVGPSHAGGYTRDDVSVVRARCRGGAAAAAAAVDAVPCPASPQCAGPLASFCAHRPPATGVAKDEG